MAEGKMTTVMDRKPMIGFLTERMLLGFGVDMVIDRVARGLVDLGYKATVYPSLTDGTFDNNSYEIKPIPTPAYNIFPRYDHSARRWLDFLNSEDIDIWLISTFPFFSLIPHLKTPAIAVDYGICSTEGFSIDNKLNFAYMKWSQQKRYFPRAAKIITISEFVKSLLPQALHKNTEVIYVGVDHYTDAWRDKGRPAAETAKFRKSIGVAENEILLTYVGRLNPIGQPYKGTMDLMAMYDEIRRTRDDVKMMMVGYGDDGDRKMIEERGIIPFVKAPADMMPVVYDATDIYVTASKWEGFDMPVAEAESFGKPVVALEIGAHTEVAVDGRTSYLVKNAWQMTEKVISLATDSGKRKEMGEAAARFVGKFSWRKIVDDYESAILEVLE